MGLLLFHFLPLLLQLIHHLRMTSPFSLLLGGRAVEFRTHVEALRFFMTILLTRFSFLRFFVRRARPGLQFDSSIACEPDGPERWQHPIDLLTVAGDVVVPIYECALRVIAPGPDVEFEE